MGLQLKDGTGGGQKPVENQSEPSANPWDLPETAVRKEEAYSVTSRAPLNTESMSKNEGAGSAIVKIILAFIVVGALIFVGKLIVSVAKPEGKDITYLIGKTEQEVASNLGVTLTNNTTWADNMLQYSGGVMTIHADEDVGVVYIDGRQVGLHINSRKYKLFGIQVGQGEKEAQDHMTFPFENFMILVDNGGRYKTTTYYYYNMERNDCVSLVLSDTTNRVVAFTYYNDLKLLLKNADY